MSETPTRRETRNQPRPVVPEFITPNVVIAAVSTYAPTVGRVYLASIYIHAKVIISTISILLNAAYPGNLRLGIYRDNNGEPDGGNIIYDSGDIAGGGATSIIHTTTTEITLQAGRYWLAVEYDTATANLCIGNAYAFPFGVANSKYPGAIFNLGAYGALPAVCPVTAATNGASQRIALKSSYTYGE